jgi:2'-5' RNA ligase
MPYGIILLPEKPEADRISEYSRRLGMSADALMVLGDDAPAHLTLAHFDGTWSAAESCWNNFSRASPTSVRVELVSLTIQPRPPGDYYIPEGGISVSLEAERTDYLTRLHELAAKAAEEVGATILGHRLFRPHVSLAVLRETEIGQLDFMPAIIRSSFTGRVALGSLGPYGTFPSILARK